MTKDQRFCYILFYYANHESKENKTSHIHKLDECVFYTSNNSKSVVIVSDTSIKNNITISITHVYVMERFGHEEFLFSFSFIFWLYRNFVFFFFFFSFRWWRGTWQGSHMTGHIMWRHRPRTWWKNLEGDVRAHEVCMVVLSKKWGEHKVEAWTIGQV